MQTSKGLHVLLYFYQSFIEGFVFLYVATIEFGDGVSSPADVSLHLRARKCFGSFAYYQTLFIYRVLCVVCTVWYRPPGPYGCMAHHQF